MLDLKSLPCLPLVLQFPNLRLDSCLRFGMGCSFKLAVDVILPGDETLLLDVNKLLDLGVILIIPVLMSLLLVTEDAFEGVHDGRG